jgi:hypothetical protein
VFIWGEPIWVSTSDTPEDLERKRRQLESVLNTITDEADAMMSGSRLPNDTASL